MQNDTSKYRSPNLLSLTFFAWYERILFTGYKRALETTDLLHISKKLTSEITFATFKSYYQKYAPKQKPAQEFSGAADSEAAKRSERQHLVRFWRSLLSLSGIPYFALHILFIIKAIFNYSTPIVMQQLLAYIQTSQREKDPDLVPSVWMGLLYCALLFICRFGVTVMTHHIYYYACDIYFNIRSSLQAAVFQKALRITPLRRQQFTTGEMMNMVSTDVDKIACVTTEGHYANVSPENFVLSIAFIYYYFGLIPTLVGVATLALVFPLSILFARLIAKLEANRLSIRDEKLKILTEVITSIRNVKFFCWEQRFQDIIEGIRHREYFALLRLVITSSLNGLSSKILGLLGAVATFTTYALLGGDLSDPKIFASLFVFNLINGYFGQVNEYINFVSAAYASSKRVSRFLSCEEIDGLELFASAEEAKTSSSKNKQALSKSTVEDTVEMEENDSSVLEFSSIYAVQMYDASFSWTSSKKNRSAATPEEFLQGGSTPEETESTTLSKINLTIEKGKFVVITGNVSSGKSSLLNAIFGDCEKVAGDMIIEGSIAYCDQTAWIMNGTVRDNILFGKEFDEQKYKEVLRVSQLEHDLHLLANGDDTEIGEQGVNLSGGQKMRLALARACYLEADVLLFDSVLNAVDPHVQNKIFQECMVEYLKGKTIILVTYSLPIIAKADHVVIMEKGTISKQGSYKELAATFNFEQLSPAEKSEPEEGKTEETQSASEKQVVEKQAVAKSNESLTQNKGKLVAEEDRAKGKISLEVVKFYFFGYGPIMLPLCILSGIISKGFEMGAQSWLSVWSAKTIVLPASHWYLLIYIALGTITCVALFSQSLSFTIGSLKSANRTHNKMVSAVLRSPVLFFDTNPTGRILNRFAKDQSTVDSDIMKFASNLYSEVLNLVGSIILICIVTPWFILAILPCAVSFFVIQQIYRRSSIEARRLESIARSPVYSHFNSCIQGASTIRACKFVAHVSKQNYFLVDQHTRSFYNMLLLNRWLGIRLEGTACAVVFMASLVAVLSRFTIQASFAALAINNSLMLTTIFLIVIRSLAAVESNLTSMERVHYYCNLKQEGPYHTSKDNDLVAEGWPQHGAIQFDNLFMRYREDLDPVLKGITVSIKAGEKVGIVGRTGSGKSSLIFSLLRMVEPASGSISIDNVESTSIGLHQLRKNVIVIPQDVHMFSGTIRSNIDVFNEHPDHEIWKALERVHIKEKIEQLFPVNMLDESIAEKGSNLSVGMKQLLLLARSILNQKAKIVVLDECTANVDLQSDALIQKTIREEFKESTILMIAHRLETVIDADKILVMSNGDVVEFDDPKTLLQNEQSTFHNMVKQMGSEYFNLLLSKIK